MDLSNECNLTREEILQSGIHHGTAALEYSHEGWGVCVGWGIDWYFCSYVCTFFIHLLITTYLPTTYHYSFLNATTSPHSFMSSIFKITFDC
jgi:hypothetical protein